jgi:hypothetical protein
MKPLPKNCSAFLSQLTEEIKTAYPDRVSEIIYRVGYLLILAGNGETAYKIWSYLLDGEFRLSRSSALMYSFQNGLSSLCYALKIPCPAIGDRSAMSDKELAKVVCDLELYSRSIMLVDRYSLQGLPLPFFIKILVACAIPQIH